MFTWWQVLIIAAGLNIATFISEAIQRHFRKSKIVVRSIELKPRGAEAREALAKAGYGPSTITKIMETFLKQGLVISRREMVTKDE